MPRETRMPITADPTIMWSLSADRKAIRQVLPPMVVAGMREPLRIGLDFDAPTIDAMLERLAILRSQMLPPIIRN
jgi:hypothetical protein